MLCPIGQSTEKPPLQTLVKWWEHVTRIYHTAYIVVGILNGYGGRGIGTTFFENLNKWAKENGILRLELTVECDNKAAKHLYEKSGFRVEGIRTKSMFVEGTFVDEYYMAKIL